MANWLLITLLGYLYAMGAYLWHFLMEYAPIAIASRNRARRRLGPKWLSFWLAVGSLFWPLWVTVLCIQCCGDSFVLWRAERKLIRADKRKARK